MPKPTNLVIFVIPSSFSGEILVKSPRECEKWILCKILLRFSGPDFFSTQNFSTKKIIFENRKFQFSKLFFSSKKFESEKKLDIKIDVKFYRESIFGIYFAIRALQRPPSDFLLLFSGFENGS